MPSSGVDAAHIIETLERHGVRYVVVGGFAVELWDVAVEPTVDVDITPERSKDNLRRLAAALNDLHAVIRSRRETVAIPGGWTAETLTQMSVLNLSTIAGPLDLTFQPAGFTGYEDLVQDSTDIEYRHLAVPTASLADVAHSKEAAGRPKDLMALPAIRSHMDRAIDG